jgi:hypothetical protein
MAGFENRGSVRVNMNVLNNNIHDLDLYFNDILEGAVPKSLVDQKLIDKSFLNELTTLLETETEVSSLAKKISSLERKINKLEDFLPTEIEVPSLYDFHLSLSPVFLQMLIETETSNNPNEFKTNCLEALRIALEEELSVWQEKTEILKS